MKDIFGKTVELKRTGKPFSFAIVIKTQGSAPRRAGTKIVIQKDGLTIGTMGGGDV